MASRSNRAAADPPASMDSAMESMTHHPRRPVVGGDAATIPPTTDPDQTRASNMFRATETPVDLTQLTEQVLCIMTFPLIVAALVWVVYHLCTFPDLIEARWDREDDWQQAEAIYRGVLDDYAAYLADPDARLDCPALDDVRNSATAVFFEALGHAESLYLDRVPVDGGRIDAFGRAARILRTAFDDAATGRGALPVDTGR